MQRRLQPWSCAALEFGIPILGLWPWLQDTASGYSLVQFDIILYSAVKYRKFASVWGCLTYMNSKIWIPTDNLARELNALDFETTLNYTCPAFILTLKLP